MNIRLGLCMVTHQDWYDIHNDEVDVYRYYVNGTSCQVVHIATYEIHSQVDYVYCTVSDMQIKYNYTKYTAAIVYKW